jgi:hypothetical protein
MSLLLLLWLLLALFGVKPAPAPEAKTAPAVTAQAAVAEDTQVTLRVAGLTPGDLYEATFAAHNGTADPYPRLLNFSAQTVKTDGSIVFTAAAADLVGASKPSFTEVRKWLRTPGSRADSPPVSPVETEPLTYP